MVSPIDTREITLRPVDWRRIYRRVKSLRPVSSKRELFAGLAWGITTSAIFELIRLNQSTEVVDAWQKPTYWAVAIGSGLIGFVIWFGGKKESDNVKILKNEIL